MSEDVCDGCGKPPRRRKNNNSDDDTLLIPLKKCTQCRLVSYHDTVCQRNHWKIHKPHCRHHDDQISNSSSAVCCTRVEEREGRGKCLVAIESIDAGQVIRMHARGNKNDEGSVAPMVPLVLFAANRAMYCAICFGYIRFFFVNTCRRSRIACL